MVVSENKNPAGNVARAHRRKRGRRHDTGHHLEEWWEVGVTRVPPRRHQHRDPQHRDDPHYKAKDNEGEGARCSASIA
eukprot:187232-Pyramimonas_sp.AAC.2